MTDECQPARYSIEVRHACGAITTFHAPNREIQIAHVTAYLSRDPVAFVTHDLAAGQGWEAKITSTLPTIVIAGGRLQSRAAITDAAAPESSSLSNIVARACLDPRDQKDHAIREVVGLIDDLVAGYECSHHDDFATLVIAVHRARALKARIR